MTTDIDVPKIEHKARKVISNSAPAAPVYGLGMIGALIYFIGHATTFWIGVLGFFKAVFWPAILVYKFLEFLNM